MVTGEIRDTEVGQNLPDLGREWAARAGSAELGGHRILEQETVGLLRTECNVDPGSRSSARCVDLPPRRAVNSGQTAKKCGLPRSVAAHERDSLAGVESDIEVVKDLAVPVTGPQAGGRYQSATALRGGHRPWGARPASSLARLAHGCRKRIPSQQPAHARDGGTRTELGEDLAWSSGDDRCSFDPNREVGEACNPLKPV